MIIVTLNKIVHFPTDRDDGLDIKRTIFIGCISSCRLVRAPAGSVRLAFVLTVHEQHSNEIISSAPIY